MSDTPPPITPVDLRADDESAASGLARGLAHSLSFEIAANGIETAEGIIYYGTSAECCECPLPFIRVGPIEGGWEVVLHREGLRPLVAGFLNSLGSPQMNLRAGPIDDCYYRIFYDRDFYDSVRAPKEG